MLDVDGRVVAAEDLIGRVEALLGRIHDSAAVPGAGARQGMPALVAPVHQMRVLQGEMHPPDVSTGPGGAGRLATLVKRAVRKMTSWYVEPRFVVQEAIDGHVVDFASEAYNAVHRLEQELDALRRESVRVRLELTAASERLRLQQLRADEVVTVADHIEGLVRDVATREELQILRKEVGAVLDRLGIESVNGADVDYEEFERRFRGSGAKVAAAQRRYLSLFPPPAFDGAIMDIGCGRGEMLRLLADEGHEVTGVDLDADMVQVCLDQGLPAVQGDGIHILVQTPPDTLKGVFCAQVVEHLLTSELEELVREAHRALRVDGVLVMETINPRSSFALGNHFYADTSHTRPVHPETLRFICEQVGFQRVQLEERSPHPSLEMRDDLPEDEVGGAVRVLLESVFGYQDYVIVATK